MKNTVFGSGAAKNTFSIGTSQLSYLPEEVFFAVIGRSKSVLTTLNTSIRAVTVKTGNTHWRSQHKSDVMHESVQMFDCRRNENMFC